VLAVHLRACHQWDKSHSDSTKTSKLTEQTIFVHKIGIDLGGTKIEGILVDEKYNTIQRKRIKTHQENGYDSIVKSIVSLFNELKAKTGEETSFGICTPGVIDANSGLVKNSNTQCLIGMPLKNDIEKALESLIVMENDANCFALAESLLGSAKGYDVVFGVIMGTGVGGGIVINGTLHKGKTNIAGEWGHHTLRPDGNECYCGKHGCVETYISGPALEKRWLELTGKKESLQSIVQDLADGKAPNGIAAAYLYIASILLGQGVLQRDVSTVSGVTEVTIRNRCAGLKTLL